VLSRTSRLAHMTDAVLRKVLEARRLDEGWSFEALYADVVRVVGPYRAPSSATLRRFVEGHHLTRETAMHTIRKYVESLQAAEQKAASA